MLWAAVPSDGGAACDPEVWAQSRRQLGDGPAAGQEQGAGGLLELFECVLWETMRAGLVTSGMSYFVHCRAGMPWEVHALLLFKVTRYLIVNPCLRVNRTA